MLFDQASALCLTVSYWTASFIGAGLGQYKEETSKGEMTNSIGVESESLVPDLYRRSKKGLVFQVGGAMRKRSIRSMHEPGPTRPNTQVFDVVLYAWNTRSNTFE